MIGVNFTFAKLITLVIPMISNAFQLDNDAISECLWLLGEYSKYF